MASTKTNLSKEDVQRARKAAKEPLNELDRFVQVTRRMFENPIWSSKKVPGAAWRVWCWMDNKTTSVEERETPINGRLWPVLYGKVNFGKPVSFDDIGTDLHCSWRSIQRSLDWLCDEAKFIKRYGKGRGNVYHFEVVNSLRKFKAGVHKAEDGELITTSPEDSWKALFAGRCSNCKRSLDKCGCELQCNECGVWATGAGEWLEHCRSVHPDDYLEAEIKYKPESAIDVEEVDDYEEPIPLEAYQ